MSIEFGGIRALDGIGFEVAERQIVGLIGPNGAGKTTVLNCICRYYTPGTGSVQFGGVNLLRRRPHQLAVVFPAGRDGQGRVAYTHWTYQQLNRETDALAHGLERIGIRPGTRTVLMVKPSLEFFALTFALFKVAAVPVLVDPGMGIANLGPCLAEAEPEAFIGIPKAQAARLLCRWARPTLRMIATAGRRCGTFESSIE